MCFSPSRFYHSNTKFVQLKCHTEVEIVTKSQIIVVSSSSLKCAIREWHEAQHIFKPKRCRSQRKWLPIKWQSEHELKQKSIAFSKSFIWNSIETLRSSKHFHLEIYFHRVSFWRLFFIAFVSLLHIPFSFLSFRWMCLIDDRMVGDGFSIHIPECMLTVGTFKFYLLFATRWTTEEKKTPPKLCSLKRKFNEYLKIGLNVGKRCSDFNFCYT